MLRKICVLLFGLSMSIAANAQSSIPLCNMSESMSTWSNCFAIIKTSDGQSYVGEVRNGKRNGKGTEKFPNGDKYVGEFKDDAANGFGTHYMSNGDLYVGYWKDNNYHGKGIFIPKDGGAIRDGLWQDDKFVKPEKTNLSIANVEKPIPLDSFFKSGGLWTESKLKDAQCQSILNNSEFATFFAYEPEKELIAMRAGGKHPNINNPALDPRKVINKNITLPIKIEITSTKPNFEIKLTEFSGQSRMVNYFRLTAGGNQFIRYKKTDCQNCVQAQIIATSQFEGPETYNWCSGSISQ